MEQNLDTLVGALVGHLGKAASSGTVAGEPMQVGEVTLVVLSMSSLGLGAGGGEGGADAKAGVRAARPGEGTGEGAGGGVKIRPVAVVVFSAVGVEVLQVPTTPDLFDKMAERMPHFVELVEKARQTFTN